MACHQRGLLKTLQRNASIVCDGVHAMSERNTPSNVLRTTEAESSSATADKWLRLPKSGRRCHVSNLSRSALNKLVLPSAQNGHQPLVRSVVLRQPWAIRGIRLINRQSLLDYIDSLDDAQIEAEAKEGR
jgi:hypothetical protein